MIDQVVEAHLPDAVRLGPDSWLTAAESGYAAYPLYLLRAIFMSTYPHSF